MLSELIDVSEADSQAIAAASYLNEKQRDEKMADLYNDYKSWKTATVRASNGSDHAVTKVSVAIDLCSSQSHSWWNEDERYNQWAPYIYIYIYIYNTH